MNQEPKFGFVVEYVKVMDASKRFYTEVLGLKMERYHPNWIQFEHFALANDESLTGAREQEVYWLVEDIGSVYKDLSQKAEIIVPLKEMPFGKVFAVKDPGGKPRFLLEFSQNRPSQAVG